MSVDIAALYERYGPMVVRRCERLLQSRADAHDAAQDVFVKVLKRGAIEDRGLSSFFWTAATRVCLNRIRDGRRTEAQDPQLWEIASTEEAERSFFRLQLFSAAKHEASDTAVMAVMHYVDGATYADVAEHFGMSESGVRKRLRGFLARTKRALEEGQHEQAA